MTPHTADRTTPRSVARMDRVAQQFQALGDPTRLAILECLRRGEHCVCELQAHIGGSQPLLSFHLKTLKHAGLVEARRDGRWMHYRVRPSALGQLRQTLGFTAAVLPIRNCC